MNAFIGKIINESRETGGTEYILKVNRLISNYESMGCTVDLYPGKFSSLNLSTIKVPPDKKNEGIGTKFIEELCSIADEYIVTVTLTPSKDFGSNLERLKGFYRRFGFKPNTGRRADHRFSNSMIREPYGYDKIEEAFGKEAEQYVKQNDTVNRNLDGYMDMIEILNDNILNVDFDENYSTQASDAMEEKFGLVAMGNPNRIFARLGEKHTVELSELSYAQPDINISGTKTNAPIHVAKIEHKMILWDGYHRVAEALLAGETHLPAIVLDLTNKLTEKIIERKLTESTLHSKEGITIGDNDENNELPNIERTIQIMERQFGQMGHALISDESDEGWFESMDEAESYAQDLLYNMEQLFKNGNIIVYRAIGMREGNDIDIDPYGIGESWTWNFESAKHFGRLNTSGKTIILQGNVTSGNVNWEKSIQQYIIFSDGRHIEDENELVIPAGNRISNVKQIYPPNKISEANIKLPKKFKLTENILREASDMFIK